MRPIKLIMQAFGPYAETETIDFTQLGNRTMFVISGKTGSGKTTIFDAISYAIYGKASGDDRNGPDLRSHFSKEETLTEVSLDFSLRGKLYSITRSPQQHKKKERGEGLTSIPAKAELYFWDEAGTKKLLASKVNDVEERIKEIMQIDSNQFRQILMIPQGEFRKLLTSDSKDKEIILQRLFHTQFYKLIEEKLKIEAVALRKAVEDQIQTRSEALRRIQVLSNEELCSLLEADSTNDAIIMPLLKKEIAAMEEKLNAFNEIVQEKGKEQDLLKAQLLEAERILSQLKLKEELKRQKSVLDGQADLFAQKEKQIKMAQKAALLTKQEELCHRLKRETVQLETEMAAIKIEKEKLDNRVKACELALQNEVKREDERQAVLEEINRLNNIKDDVYSYAALVNEVKNVETALARAKEKQQSSELKLGTTEGKLKALLNQKGEIEQGQVTYLENKHRLERMQTELDRLQKYENILTQKERAEEQLKLAEERCSNTTARYSDAKALVEELERRWLHGQAAVLAARLKSGEACPVCGSEHHPAPADYNDEIPHENDLKSAKEQAATLDKERAKSESAFFDCQSTEKRQREALLEVYQEILIQREDFRESDLHDVKAVITADKTHLTQIQNKLAEQNKLHNAVQQELENSEEEKSALQKAIQRHILEVNNFTILFTEKKTNLMRMLDAIPENLRTVDEYEKAFAFAKRKHEGLLKLLEEAQKQLQTAREYQSAAAARLADAAKYLSGKQKELETERANFKKQMSDQGFESYSLYENSKRTEGEILILEKEIRNFREDVRSVSDRLNELIELLKDVTTPDIGILKANLEKVTEEVESLNHQRTDLFIKKRDNEDIYNLVERLNEHVKSLEEKYNLLGHLYDIARGQNTYRITFERYVLAAFLDDILREANSRLRKMTAGRYQLLRKTDRSKGNIQSGLELLVFDQYTGQERHVKTLSGGESFKASLSLALGLADVVQNYAGGVSLETMFIDEGFGTLDPESLEQAIESLMDIQNSGRLVGIISHVPELKERIDVRLEVTAEQSGSRTAFIFSN